MAHRRTELGLIKIFRGYCGFVLVYFMGFYVYTVFVTHTFFSPSFILFYVNLANFAILFGYLSWVWLEKRFNKFYFPIAILIASIVPMYSSVYFWPFELVDPVSDIVFRSWYLFPILVVPCTLIAWQYGHKIALGFVLLLSFYDFPFIILRIDALSAETLQLLGVPILRTIAFGTIGVIVGLLMDSQRKQRRKLIQANIQLGNHAKMLEELATSRERNRLARELHDTLAHTLSSQILTLEALRLSPPTEEPEIDAVLKEMITSSRQGLSETRRALKDLRARQLDDLGLKQSLLALLEDAASRAHVEINAEIDGDIPPISDDIEQCIYRIAQEGIENIIRHASAKNISMAMVQKENTLTFSLTDNGSGFNKHAINIKEKHGIKGMRERAADHGGDFQISTTKRGTRITVKFEVEDDSRLSL